MLKDNEYANIYFLCQLQIRLDKRTCAHNAGYQFNVINK